MVWLLLIIFMLGIFMQQRQIKINQPIVNLYSDVQKSSLAHQLLYGQECEILDNYSDRDILHVKALKDGYSGYLSAHATTAIDDRRATHYISQPLTCCLSDCDVKSLTKAQYPFGALVHITQMRHDYAYDAHIGWFYAKHLTPINRICADQPHKMAQRFLHAPYLWGGNSALGLDCSALVQNAFAAVGWNVPRDSAPQSLDKQFYDINKEELQANDLIFWRGHVAMMIDYKTIIHANGYDMCVAMIDLDKAIDGINQRQDSLPIAFKRYILT